MDMLGVMRSVNKIGTYLILTVFVFNLFGIVFAQPSGAAASIGSALEDLCSASRTFLAGAIMIMIILAGATYAIGQILGAETRARASVWATAMLTGAIIGALIFLLVPIIINALLPAGVSQLSPGGDPCNFV